MKKPVKIVLALVVVLVIAAVAVPFLIPAETYKKEIVARVAEMTGRTLTINGPLKARIFPAIGVTLEQATLSNPAGYSSPTMVEVQSMAVEVALAPLLSGQIEVKRFVLDKPVIRLEKNAAGAPNWEFTPSAAAPRAAAFSLIGEAQAQSALANLRLGEMKITDGEIDYRDGQTKAHQQLSSVNLEAELPTLASPLAVNGSAVWNREEVKLKGRLETLQQLLDGKTANAELNVSSALTKLDFKGQATMSSAAGDVSLNLPSLPKLAAWTGSPFVWKAKAPLAFDAKGKIECATNRCALNKAELALDDIKAKGEMGVNFGGNVPYIAAHLATDALDVNPYLPPAEAKQAGLMQLLVADAQAAGWSNDAIDLSSLRAANADIDIAAGKILYQNIKIGKSTLNAKLSGGVLKLNLPSMELYGGKGKAVATIDASGGVPAISKQFEASGIQAEPFLKDAADFDRLSGTGAANISVTGRGASQQQIVSSLNGSGSVKFTDGSIKGINLAEMVRNVQSAFTGAGGTAQKTDFAELGGTFTMAQGIVSNKDLGMKAPLLRLKGEGTVDLPQRFVRYRVTPEIVGTITGQGGKDKSGLAVPVLIEGPFEHLSYRPDLEGMARDALQNPEKLKDTVKNVKDQFKGGGIKDLKNNDAVKDLLKGLR